MESPEFFTSQLTNWADNTTEGKQAILNQYLGLDDGKVIFSRIVAKFNGTNTESNQ